MRWILAALLLLLVQAFAWRVPSSSWMPGQDRSLPEVVSMLQGRNASPQPVELVGRVVDASPVASGGVRLTVDAETVDGARVRGMVNASLRETNRTWRTGDRVALHSRLRRIAGFGNFGEMDYAAYCARRGILVSAGAWNADDAKALDAEDGAVDGMRRRFSAACEAVGGQGAEILEALTIGDRTGMDTATSDSVRDAGLAHFLAISGSHMALIVALVVGLVRRGAGLSTRLLQGYDVLRLAAVCGAVAVVAYGVVAGGGVSVARSVLMAVAAMVALWQGRPGDDLRALGGSAIVLALAMPGVGEEAGFQLSYLAVAALMLESRRQRALQRAQGGERSGAGATVAGQAGAMAMPPAGSVAPIPAPAAATASALPTAPSSTLPSSLPIAPRSTRRRLGSLGQRGLELLREAAWLTVVCWIVTTPVVAHHFQRVSLVAPLANLLAAPLVSAVVVAGLLGLLLLPLAPWAGMACVYLGSLMSAWILAIAKWCASLPLAATATPAPGPWLTLLLTGLALSLLLPAGRRRRRLAVGLAAGALVLVGWGLFERYRSDRLDVWFASVGQGDAAVVRLPGGQVWVVDAGPPGRGRMVVGPLLRRLWVGRIDVLVASHLQADHAGAAPELLQDFAVGEFRVPDGPCEASYARSLVKAAETAGVSVRRGSRTAASNGGPATGMDPSPAEVAQGLAAGAAAPLALANAEVDVATWWPPAGARPCNENNQSQVLAFSYAGRRIVFTGDVEKEAELAMLQASVPDSLRSDVLKVPHHGSRTSSSPQLLNSLRPALAVASVGLDNQWHFPAADVVARYDALGTRLLRTDRDGAVHLVVNRDGALTVETFGGEAFPLLPLH